MHANSSSLTVCYELSVQFAVRSFIDVTPNLFVHIGVTYHWTWASRTNWSPRGKTDWVELRASWGLPCQRHQRNLNHPNNAQVQRITPAVCCLASDHRYLLENSYVLHLHKIKLEPCLACCVQFWAPHFQLDMNYFEKVQKLVTKMIAGQRYNSYGPEVTTQAFPPPQLDTHAVIELRLPEH